MMDGSKAEYQKVMLLTRYCFNHEFITGEMPTTDELVRLFEVDDILAGAVLNLIDLQKANESEGQQS